MASSVESENLSRVFAPNDALETIQLARELGEEPPAEAVEQFMGNVDSYRPVIDEVTTIIDGTFSESDRAVDLDRIRENAAEAVLEARVGAYSVLHIVA